ncbi:MAG: hypothetical protein ABSC20_12445 [Candidatus Bathyarchaeia archaeon]|jgi:hypothetical protein
METSKSIKIVRGVFTHPYTKELIEVDGFPTTSRINNFSRPSWNLNEPTIKRYMEDIKSGKKLASVIVDNEHGKITPYDGYHRIEAYRRLGVDEITTIKISDADAEKYRADKFFKSVWVDRTSGPNGRRIGQNIARIGHGAKTKKITNRYRQKED